MFEQVLDLVGSVSATPGDRLSPAQLLDRITAAERAIAALRAAQARDLAAFSDRRVAADVAAKVPDQLVGRSIGTEVGLALGVGQQAAANRVAQAWVTVRHHPRLLDRLGTGQVTMTGVRLVLRQTEPLDEADRRVVDAQVAELAEIAQDAGAEPLTPARLAQAAARCALSVDPDAAVNRAATARSRRRVWLGDPVDGVAGLGAVLRAEESLACWTSLDRTARRMRQDGDDRTVQQLMADLLVERLTGTPLVRVPAPVPAPVAAPDAVPVRAAVPPVWRTSDGWEPWTATTPPPLVPDADPAPDDPAWDTVPDTVPDTLPDTVPDTVPDKVPDTVADCDPPQRPPPEHRLPASVELQVVMSAETLLGLDDEPALLRGHGGMAAYGPIAAEVARDIADVASRRTLIGLFTDPVDGRLLTMDSKSRFLEGRLRDLCRWRDQYCRLGGGRIGHLDHRQEVHLGGETIARNGQSLSRLSHRLKDHPAITGDVVDTTAPNGHHGNDGKGLEGLNRLRANAPTLAWTMPTGHRYTSTPPPALGPGARPDPQHWADQVDERQAYKDFVTACHQAA